MDHAARARALNALGFLLGGFACVAGAAWGRPWLGPAVAALLLGAHGAFCSRPRRELRRLAAVGIFGVGVESAAGGAGLYGYAGGWGIWWLAPGWIAALWLLLGATFESSLRPLDRKPGLAAAAGALGGAFAFGVATRLGAARFIAPDAVGLTAVAALWAAALPSALAVSRLAGRKA
ncbi:MAG: DUF2878 family protein [Elusimicrobiota bacterium]